MAERPLDQHEAPLLDAMAAMLKERLTPFSLPGHKQGRGADPATLAVLGERVFRCDVALDGAMDDRTASHGYDSRAEKLAAAAMGAGQVLLSTNGSSMSLQVASLGVAGPGDEIVLARNLHKSNYNALILSGARPVFVQPEWDTALELAHSITPAAVEAALAEHPAAKAVVMVSPTYYGVIADVAGVAAVCHARGIPLIVDDAWGAHLIFHPELPASALESGADIAVSSLHKAGAGLMQGSVIAIQGDLVDPVRIQHTLALLESTSTSMLILAALDGARRQLAVGGKQLLDRVIGLSRDVRRGVAAIDGLSVMGREVLTTPGTIDLDETKVVIDVSALGITGFAASDWLIANHRVLCELADHRRVMTMITLGDDEATVARLLSTLTELAAAAPSLPGRGTVSIPDVRSLATELVISPREAFFAPRHPVRLADAEGEVAAEPAIPYPPGIPVILPGERWTRPIIDYMRAGIAAGMHAADSADPKLETVLVVG
ncbi:MAG: aminotransferase class I/II-fold pyridoxal phosphate-dependent enzyme, partial [Candidatus Dormibacteria bacterium]